MEARIPPPPTKGHQTGGHLPAPPTSGWLCSRVVIVLDSGAERPGFKSQPRRHKSNTLVTVYSPISGVPIICGPPANIRYGLTVLIHNSGHFGPPLPFWAPGHPGIVTARYATEPYTTGTCALETFVIIALYQSTFTIPYVRN